jgi:hypothetical protein
MDLINGIIVQIDDILDTERKRHICGGMLLSIAMLFGGLALTIMTIRTEEKKCTKQLYL